MGRPQQTRPQVDIEHIKQTFVNPGSTVPVLSELVGSSVSCCCTRLGKKIGDDLPERRL